MFNLASKPCLLINPIITASQFRGMATIKDIRLRLKSVKNIQKITQSMKMVSAAKYARAERDLKNARGFGEGAQVFYSRSELETKDKKDETPPTLLIALTSDRGLCGAVHSSVAKKIRSIMATDPNASNLKIVLIGDKAKAMLSKQFSSNVFLMFNDFGKKPPSFGDATEVANSIIDSGVEYSKGIIIYNKFKSVVSYSTTELPIFSMQAIENSPKMSLYDSLDADILRSYHEYLLGSVVFYAMKENFCSEQSSRMTAMDNASKNAGEMIQQLTLSFNRTRQAVITRELIEIISGAAALD